jgi:hypothetical protein
VRALKKEVQRKMFGPKKGGGGGKKKNKKLKNVYRFKNFIKSKPKN